VARATLDTNVYVSAFVFGGTPRRLLDLAIDRKLNVAISEAILEEILRVLREKFGWSQDRLDSAKELITSFAQTVAPSQTLHIIDEDLTDNRILECAAEAGSDYIVSGDKHLHRIGHYGNARVVRVADMLDLIQGRSSHSYEA
jgi:uncharacterized protein